MSAKSILKLKSKMNDKSENHKFLSARIILKWVMHRVKCTNIIRNNLEQSIEAQNYYRKVLQNEKAKIEEVANIEIQKNCIYLLKVPENTKKKH